MSKNRFKGFNVEEPSSTRVELPVDVGSDPNQFGSISQYKPNLIDKISDKMPKGVMTDLLKGLYRGADDITFGLLPSGNYQSDSRVSDMAEKLSWGLSPKGVGKSAKYVVSGGTPVSRLIANSIEPRGYSNKWNQLKRVLTNPKVFKEAVIKDIPQYKLPSKAEDRLFAWRKKLGLGKPNPKYNDILDPRWKNERMWLKDQFPEIPLEKYKGSVTPKKLRQVDKIWDKFGKNPDGSYYYKNPKDYFKGQTGDNMHALFGSYVRKPRTSKGFKYEDYEDNWDFARNRSLNKRMEVPLKRLFQGDVKGFAKRELDKLPISIQRNFAEMFLKPLVFKGSAKVQ